MGVGYWGGIPIRLHAFFLLFAACTFYLGYLAEQNGHSGCASLALISLGILLASVLLHELGHVYAAQQLGGGVDELVLGPFGGLKSPRPPADAPGELIVHLAGPLVNLGVCVICLPWLLSVEGPRQVLGLLHPFQPSAVVGAEASWITTLKLVFWINWVLLLVNLLPAFLVDGGRALQALAGMLWNDAARHHVAAIVAGFARLAAVGLLILAWVLRESGDPFLPIWFPLTLLAIGLFFGARQTQTTPAPTSQPQQSALETGSAGGADDDLFGYDFSQGFTSLERSSHTPPPPPGLWQRWHQQRQDARRARQRRVEQEEERQVDEILDRLHRHGMENLTAQDRSLLERVSHRYRQRHGDQA